MVFAYIERFGPENVGWVEVRGSDAEQISYNGRKVLYQQMWLKDRGKISISTSVFGFVASEPYEKVDNEKADNSHLAVDVDCITDKSEREEVGEILQAKTKGRIYFW